jgi:hypothetical protein
MIVHGKWKASIDTLEHFKEDANINHKDTKGLSSPPMLATLDVDHSFIETSTYLIKEQTPITTTNVDQRWFLPSQRFCSTAIVLLEPTPLTTVVQRVDDPNTATAIAIATPALFRKTHAPSCRQ